MRFSNIKGCKMRSVSFLFGLVLITLAQSQANDLPLADLCEEEKCKLPECRCSSTEIPGGLEPRNTPQFVILTFDDAMNTQNGQTYRALLNNRFNKNRCHIGATFFISHEYTDYSVVNEMYNRGYEIALHSITHKVDQEYWRTGTVEQATREFGDQRRLIANFANIPQSAIHGIRSPFIQLSGNSTFQMLAETGLRYDLSWPTTKYTNPGLWPYTLHYASTQDCIVGPCPTASIRGPWVIPMVSWTDLQGFPCSFVDACYANPDSEDENAWFEYILKQFERHYLGTRAPFGFYIHEWFVRVNPGLRKALIRFMDMLNNLNDAFMVNAHDVINWVQNPVPINEYVKQECPRFIRAACRRTTCGSLKGVETGKTYYMTICNRCPRVYPWLNNPLGR